MKPPTILALALALLGLAACGGEQQPVPRPPAETAVAPTPARAKPAATEDSPVALQRLIEKLSAAAVAGETAEALTMCRSLLLPDPGTWFAERFGAEIGARLTTEYASRAKQIDTLPALFPRLSAKGQTELLVERHEDPEDPEATGYQSVAMANMQKPTRLYSVRFLEPEQDTGFSLWSFVHVDGAFRFAGKMRAVDPEERSPHAAMLGELRRRDAEKFLEGGK